MAERPRRQTRDSHSLRVIKSGQNKCNVLGDTKQRGYMEQVLKAVMVKVPMKAWLLQALVTS